MKRLLIVADSKRFSLAGALVSLPYEIYFDHEVKMETRIVIRNYIAKQPLRLQ
jgi:hypothetical protein